MQSSLQSKDFDEYAVAKCFCKGVLIKYFLLLFFIVEELVAKL